MTRDPFTEIPLPRTLEEFDFLVDEVCAEYCLTEREHAAAVIANAISHLDNDTATSSIAYFGNRVLKQIANQIANAKRSLIDHKQQIKLIVEELKTNPGNFEARDELEKAASNGSKYAKEALLSLDPPPTLPTGTDTSGVKH